MHYRLPYVGIDLSYLVLQPDTSLAYTARPWIRASVSRDVPQLLLGTHFTYPLMDGSGWAGWVPGSALRSFTRPKTVTHPGTNLAWCRLTTLTVTAKRNDDCEQILKKTAEKCRSQHRCHNYSVCQKSRHSIHILCESSKWIDSGILLVRLPQLIKSMVTISSPNHYDCIVLIIVLYYCVLLFYDCILFSPLFSLMATIF